MVGLAVDIASRDAHWSSCKNLPHKNLHDLCLMIMIRETTQIDSYTEKLEHRIFSLDSETSDSRTVTLLL